MSNPYIDSLIIFGLDSKAPDHFFSASATLSTRQIPRGTALSMEAIQIIQRNLIEEIARSIAQDARFFRQSEKSADYTMAVKLDAVVFSIEELEQLLTTAYNKGFERGATGLGQ